MARWTMNIWPLMIAGVVLVPQASVGSPVDDLPLPVSVERIRKALEAPPPRLRPPPPSSEVATFRVEVRQQLFDLESLDEDPFDPTYGLPSVGELLSGGIGKLRSAVAGYKRGRAERRARKEVENALAAFCAVHDCQTSNGK